MNAYVSGSQAERTIDTECLPLVSWPGAKAEGKAKCFSLPSRIGFPKGGEAPCQWLAGTM